MPTLPRPGGTGARGHGPPGNGGRLRPAPRHRSDRGGQLLEYAAYFPLLLLVSLMAVEAFLGFVVAERLESSARAGARAAGEHTIAEAEAVARQALPPWMSRARVTGGENGKRGYYVEASHPVPVIFTAVDWNLEVTRRVEMPDV